MSILRVGLVLLILPMAMLLGGYFSELSTVNDCLREQGSFDYFKQLCDHNKVHEFVPYSQRHTTWVNGSMIVAVVGVVLCALGLYKGKR